jgi:hypothetical protein
VAEQGLRYRARSARHLFVIGQIPKHGHRIQCVWMSSAGCVDSYWLLGGRSWQIRVSVSLQAPLAL